MLDGIRVVDLSEGETLLCGQMLADLGADVLQVTPPPDSSTHAQAPLSADGSEAALTWAAFTRNKRHCGLDLDDPGERERLRTLLREADVLIEGVTPGRRYELGLDPDALAAANPALVQASITPFGGTGPKASYAGTDLTLMAASGVLYLCGEPEKPVRLSVPQAWLHAAADAAVGVMIALAERRRSGRGQHLDVAVQQSLTLATLCRSLDAPLGSEPAPRAGSSLRLGGVAVRSLYPSADGWVVVTPGIIPPMSAFMTRLMAWAHELDLAEADLVETDWGSVGQRLSTGELEASFWTRVDAVIEQLVATRTNTALMNAAVERKLLLAPSFSIGQVVESPQLQERDFMVADGDSGMRLPGPFARLPASPLRYRHPPLAPAQAVREDPTGNALFEVREPPAVPKPGPEPRCPPLEGVKILDLFWVVAGPGATRMLADFGATVVKVESSVRQDTFRNIPPYEGGEPDPERAGGYQSTNANKLNVCLDLAHPDAAAVVADLVRWADVVTESFAPGVIERFGFGYEALRAINPAVILVSSSLMGQTGPWRAYAGFGNLAAAVSGFHRLGGWPEAPPTGVYGPYTDFIGVRYNAVAILAALEHRARTGEGQHVDMHSARRRYIFSPPRCSTGPSMAVSVRPWAMPMPVCRPMRSTRAPATTRGWPSPWSMTRCGHAWLRSLAGRTSAPPRRWLRSRAGARTMKPLMRPSRPGP